MTKRLTSPTPTPTIERNQVASGLGIGISNDMIYEGSNAGQRLTDYIHKYQNQWLSVEQILAFDKLEMTLTPQSNEHTKLAFANLRRGQHFHQM